MNKKNIIKIKNGRRTLYYQPLAETRQDGVCATLIGYRESGRDFWY